MWRMTALNLINNSANAGTAISLDFSPSVNIPLARINANRTNFSGYYSGDTDLEFYNYSSGLHEQMVIKADGNVGIGTTDPGSYKLAVEGNIGARDVIVTNSPWSDYVFQPGYRLRPLNEVGAYIQANHHLPGIPSEAEVKEKGVSLGDMQSKLLAKIEELTLHMIQQQKENQELRERIALLEKRAPGGTTSPAGK
jgi:hypothetical protein